MTEPLRLLIVEDEASVARQIERLAREALNGRPAEIQRASSLDEAQALVGRKGTILLLDLNLGGEDGFDLLRRAAASPSEVIVVSANVDRAIEAFAWGVADFVPKPFDADRMALALGRALGERTRPPGAMQFVAAKSGARFDAAPVESIVLIRGADDYAEVALIGGRTLLSGKTLASLERALPSDFLRVHRSHIVNLRRVVRLSPRGGGLREVELEGGLIAPVSRAAWPRLKSRLVS